MNSYTLTQISGSNYTVYLDGTILTAAQFKTAFLDNAGTAEFTSSVATSGVTLWDSAEMTGNSISTTEAIEANTPYNGAWSAVTGVTTNTFTSFLKATGKTLTDYQLSQLAKLAKEGKVKTLTTSDYNFHATGSTDNGVAVWLLDSGVYKIGEALSVYDSSKTSFKTYLAGGILVVANLSNGQTDIIATRTGSGSYAFYRRILSDHSTNTADTFVFHTVDDLTSGGSSPLSAQQGKVLKGLIDTLDAKVVNFTGTDGTDAGKAGLVPAPATTDADKFLKSDGTWGEAGGSGIPTNATFWGASYDSTNNKVDGNITSGTPFSVGLTGGNSDIVFSDTIGTGVSPGVNIRSQIGQIYFKILDRLTWNSIARFNVYGLYMSSHRIAELADPTDAQDAATKNYVDTLVGDIETALNTINNGGGN